MALKQNCRAVKCLADRKERRRISKLKHERKESQTNYTVYGISVAITVFVAGWSIIATESFMAAANRLYEYLSINMGWLYLLIIAFFVVFCIYLAVSRYGRIKLGGDDEEPEYTTSAWFAMLFCAGMGVGLVFWGVAEPLSHFLSPDGMEGGTAEAAEFAIKSTFMHWGVHPWAIYGVIGLSIAYFSFRKGEKSLISSTLIPLIGREKSEGALGKGIDIFTVFITIMGISTSLGLGALQINGGLSSLTDFPFSLKTQILIILLVTVVFTLSSVSGIDKGIRLLSSFNLYLAVALAAVAFIVGPKLEIINSLVGGVGSYVSDIVEESLHLSPYGDNNWTISWRVFYWAWWISWGPFVGCFIARISKGRTIREFVIGVLLVPTAASCIWFAIFGNLGINLGKKDILPLSTLAELTSSPETALFAILNEYSLGTLLSVIAILLLFTFFVTSADSGTFVLGMFSSEGNLDPSPARKISWAVMISLLAIGLLISGGLNAIQTISLVVAFPFLFIMLACCKALYQSLKGEYRNQKNRTAQ